MLPALPLLALLLTAHAQLYTKVVHNTDPQARCLDGSPAALYIHEGSSTNMLLYFQGGGVCSGNSLAESVEDCYRRSLTFLGSSLYWPATLKTEGLLSTDPTKNIFADWTKVILVYCDGAFHQGTTKAPLKYRDTQLYFRGAAITRAHLKYLDGRYGLGKVEKMVVAGSSAGGVAAFAWADQIRAQLSPKAKFNVVVDSGILLSNSEAELATLFQLANKDETVPNSACGAAWGKTKEWNCMTIQGALPYLQAETLFLQSGYDQFILEQRLHIGCVTAGHAGPTLSNCDLQAIAEIDQYHQLYTAFLPRILELGHNLWSINCVWHAGMLLEKYYASPLQKVPMTKGITMQEAIYAHVIEGQKVLAIDLGNWPANDPCAY